MNPEEIEVRVEFARDLFDDLRRRICKISDEVDVRMTVGCKQVEISIDGDVCAIIQDGSIAIYENNHCGEPMSVIELTNKEYKESVLDTMLMLM